MITYPIEKDGCVTQCCDCKRIKVIDENVNITFEKRKIPDDKKINSTYCPDCFVVAMAQVKADFEQLKGGAKCL